MLDAWAWWIIIIFVILGLLTGVLFFVGWLVFKALQFVVLALVGVFILLIRRIFGV